MKNIDFLKQILTTEHDYWVVAKEEWMSDFGREKRLPDSLWVVSIPYVVSRGMKVEDIKLVDLEKLYNAELPNISLTHNYAPFQYGIMMGQMRMGYPITKDIKQTVINLLNACPKDIYSCKDLLNREPEAQECDARDDATYSKAD